MNRAVMVARRWVLQTKRRLKAQGLGERKYRAQLRRLGIRVN